MQRDAVVVFVADEFEESRGAAGCPVGLDFDFEGGTTDDEGLSRLRFGSGGSGVYFSLEVTSDVYDGGSSGEDGELLSEGVWFRWGDIMTCIVEVVAEF
mmetsp:Transcript_17324/g.31326  ORF Transcript_17324/g.31326 Transcript_17324/m.31326 type:complete len:99 (+) Transcript_17324:789-1085(+)|eukprot:CAMPEP_0201610120 /NCGR_PEP_ID=MMETSP0492-20130828/15849_1 /ASSEMBLY_ACC=CAM_ASM_000837 /TAXON_ID=420259 /ORGANISM="Thalassiosira gravida, Strain GMp14c1" /LENGTH=98 /DNA_ID=CAMNT_0048075817 /DNA_START=909 /DNA_END=1205 /DNA_ORIENTATION=+